MVQYTVQTTQGLYVKTFLSQTSRISTLSIKLQSLQFWSIQRFDVVG